MFYSYTSIRLHSILCQASLIACLRLRVAVLEDFFRREGLDGHEPAVAEARARALVCKQMGITS